MKKCLAAALFLLTLIVWLPGLACAEDGAVYEAELAVLYGSNTVMEDADASGGKAVGKFEDDDSYVEFRVKVSDEGYYDLTFTMKGIGNKKYNMIEVDGTNVGTVSCAMDVYTASVIQKIPLSVGSHIVSVRKEWGWICLDKLVVSKTEKLSPSIYDVTEPLSNPNATPETQQLYKLLCDCYGRYTLSGQFSDDGIEGDELSAIFSVAGKYPAVLGLDMAGYTPGRKAGINGRAVEHAITFHNLGGIVTFCWHWSAPANSIPDGYDENGEPRWWGGFYAKNTAFDILRVMQGYDPEGKAVLDSDIQAIAAQLKRLEEHHVPVLWRPLHEAAGEWFWWGTGGPECFKQLWIYLYRQLTEVYECNNLIWVWNGLDPAWYPGDEYVDILSDDIYVAPGQYSTYIGSFADLVDYPEHRKIIALSEDSSPPDMDACLDSGVMWSWFCTWKKDYVVKNGEYSSAYTDRDILRTVYNHEAVITLDELPDLFEESLRAHSGR